MPDADRRLMYEQLLIWFRERLQLITIFSYIANLDPAYIYALFQRASFRQVAVLRYAIWKHIAFQTSIRVKIPVST